MNRIAQWVQNTVSKQILTVLALAAGLPCWAQNGAPLEQRNRTVLVSLVDRKLAVIDNGVVVATFQIAVGADVSPSPAGEFKIVSRVSNPTYYHRGTVIPTGKDNPIGTRWLGLSVKGYGIHGTNAPRSIGRAASHGCIRLRNRDMERLFTMLKIGDAVQIHGERDEQVARVFDGEIPQTQDLQVTIAENTAQNTEQREAGQSVVGLGN